MKSTRFVSALAALAVLTLTVPATAQTVAYINFLQFDLQSYRSQATGAMFPDDVEHVANAARLMDVEGNVFISTFANLNEPATVGDNLITYSSDSLGEPDLGFFDSGSYLGGFIGKYDEDSDYMFSVFYQRNGSKVMFENLEDGNLGAGLGGSLDAEFTANTVVTLDNGAGGNTAGDGIIDAQTETNASLMRYDDRSALNFDFGVARDISEDLSVGGRAFFERDALDRFADGRTEVISRSKLVLDGPLVETGRTVTTWTGLGEDAFKHREIGISLDGDYHAWADQSFNVRLDIFGANLTNPSSGLGLPSRGFEYLDPVGVNVDKQENRSETRAAAGTGTAGNGVLAADRTNTTVTDQPYDLGVDYYRGLGGIAVESVDDERTGIGLAFLGEYDREWAGGDARTWAGLSRRPLDIDATAVGVDKTTDMFWWNSGVAGASDQLATREAGSTITVKRSGDMTATTMEAGARWSRELSNKVSVGLGIVGTRSKWKEDYKATVDSVYVESFDDGDAALDELLNNGGNATHNEQTESWTTTTETNVEDETRVSTIRLPVGAQFKFGKKWTWNMGATHNINYFTRETSESTPIEGNGRTVHVLDDADPAVTDVTDYAIGGFEHGPETVTDQVQWNTTTFWYGLEWMFSDDAQVNINGMFDTHGGSSSARGTPANEQILDTEFFRNLAISITFFFR